MNRSADVLFFKRHAGYSIAPGETREQGRLRCARALADAEARGRDAGLSFEWSVDPDSDSSDWCDEMPTWQVWQCYAHDESGAVVAYMGAVDFGRDGSPHSDPYRRVVEAELAAEALSRANS